MLYKVPGSRSCLYATYPCTYKDISLRSRNGGSRPREKSPHLGAQGVTVLQLLHEVVAVRVVELPPSLRVLLAQPDVMYGKVGVTQLRGEQQLAHVGGAALVALGDLALEEPYFSKNRGGKKVELQYSY